MGETILILFMARMPHRLKPMLAMPRGSEVCECIPFRITLNLGGDVRVKLKILR